MKKPCGCCGGIAVVTPEPEYNRPGLPAIAYRAGSYATFPESMLARLSTVFIDVAADAGTGTVSRLYPLKSLTTRELSDPSIALLDAWAVVADVLTFYQERIANEGYLGTATERVSVLELARLIGYRPRPGVAASVFLAFTATNGFAGEIPAGTRAQSMPGAGQTAQYFETSTKLLVRDTWNSLQPRLTRPQVISPPAPPTLKGSKRNQSVAFDNHLGTNADVVDSIYLEGIATNLKVNDVLLLVLSQDPGEQFLRFVERVDAQADQSRTLVALRANTAASQILAESVDDVLQRFIDDGPSQFPGNDLAAGTAALLQGILTQEAIGPGAAAAFARGVVPQVQAFHDVAVKRQFHRVEIWLQHLLDLLPGVVRTLEQGAGRSEVAVPARQSFAASSLERLGALLPALSLTRSVPPASPARLARSVAVSFASHSDTMPRLLAALHPVAAPIVYHAWGGVQPVHIDLAIYAARVKATLHYHRIHREGLAAEPRFQLADRG